MRRLLAGFLLGLAPVALAARGEDDLVKQLDSEVIALKQRITALNALVEECGGGKGPDPIFPELVQVYGGTQVSVKRRGGRTLVVIPADLLFPGETLTIREEATFALDMAATALANHPEESVLVTGHTDGEPPVPPLRKRYTTNWELSVGYAGAVAQALIDQYKLDPARITVAGRADQDPNDTNDTPEGRAANRRVVLTISPGKYP
jgi:flagellar motor protein MotB